MQYPIIDLITNAYINNGWTGLNLKDDANFNIFPLTPGFFSSSGGIQTWAEDGERYTEDYINVNAFSSATLNYYNYPSGTSSFWKSFCTYDSNKNFIERIAISSNEPLTINFSSNVKYIRFSLRTYDNGNEYIYLSFDNDQSGGYSDNTTDLTDFPNRLKLPLPHYFPHPVIDALQRAAAGTQTGDDTEILRHYLTPLGIGGI